MAAGPDRPHRPRQHRPGPGGPPGRPGRRAGGSRGLKKSGEREGRVSENERARVGGWREEDWVGACVCGGQGGAAARWSGWQCSTGRAHTKHVPASAGAAWAGPPRGLARVDRGEHRVKKKKKGAHPVATGVRKTGAKKRNHVAQFSNAYHPRKRWTRRPAGGLAGRVKGHAARRRCPAAHTRRRLRCCSSTARPRGRRAGRQGGAVARDRCSQVRRRTRLLGEAGRWPALGVSGRGVARVASFFLLQSGQEGHGRVGPISFFFRRSAASPPPPMAGPAHARTHTLTECS